MLFKLLLILASFSRTTGSTEPGYLVACHYDSWDNVGTVKLTVSDLDVTNCTHILYNYVHIDESIKTLRSRDSKVDYDDNGGQGYFKKLSAKKKYHKDLKIIPVIEDTQVKKLIELSETSDGRRQFAWNTKSFIRNNNFDGLAISLRDPFTDEDKETMERLIKELRKAFVAYDLSLVVLVWYRYMSSYPISEVKDHLSLIIPNSMAYHLYDKYTRPYSPLFSNDIFDPTVEKIVQYVMDQGVPPSKILLSLGFSGIKYKVRTLSKRIFGEIIKEDSAKRFNELCPFLKYRAWERHWDEESRTPLITKEDELITYNDAESLGEKVKYGKCQNLRGVHVWNMEYDDFRGICDQGKYPLMNAVLRELYQPSEKCTRGTPTPPICPIISEDWEIA